MCAGLGIAIKPVIVPLAHIITGPLFIPGGAVAGGFYMLFIVLPAGLIQKPGASTLTCVVQALLVIITGVIGSHGIMSLLTYVAPGILVDLFLLVFILRKKSVDAAAIFFAGILANLTGTFASNLVFFRLPVIPLMLTLVSAALSGGLGGLIAWQIVKGLRKLNPVFTRDRNKERITDEK